MSNYCVLLQRARQYNVNAALGIRMVLVGVPVGDAIWLGVKGVPGGWPEVVRRGAGRGCNFVGS